MHRKGDKVFITKTGKTYHYKDDDCGVTSSILKGKRPAMEISEEEAIERGYKLCLSCAKEYREDLAERKAMGCSTVFILVPLTGIISWLFQYIF